MLHILPEVVFWLSVHAFVSQDQVLVRHVQS